MIKKVTGLCLAVLMLGLAMVAHAAPPGPTDQLKETVDAILVILKDNPGANGIKDEKILALVDERFNFTGMAQRVLAKNWRKASAEQKARFVELFRQLLSNSYLGRVRAYTDEKVRYGKEQIKKEKYAMVDTVIVSGNTDIPIDYKLQLMNDKWLVYDVVIEEVSLVQTYRSNYQTIVNDKGMDGLLVQMKEKLDEPVEEGGASPG